MIDLRLLSVDRKQTFHRLYIEHVYDQLRNDIASTLLSRTDEAQFHNLGSFLKSKLSVEEKNILIERICSILEDSGWKTRLSFGGTGLFIYTTNDPPPNCW